MLEMKKLPFCTYCVFLLASFISCNNRITTETDQFGNEVIKEWYNQHKVKSIKTIFGKNRNECTYVLYDKDGGLLDSARYLNDTLEGTRKFLEEKTMLIHTENYRQGMLHGPHKAVYSTGITGFEGCRKNNLMVGEWKFHFSDGHPITYEYYDSLGIMKYFRKYDDDGNVLKVNGIGMIQVKSDQSNLDSLQTLFGFVEAAIPPGCITQFTIQEIKGGQPAGILLDEPLTAPKTEWKISFTEPGTKNLKYLVTITDKKTGKKEESVSQQTIQLK